MTSRKFDLSINIILYTVICAIALSHDLFRDIAAEADSDFTGIYQALRLNDGLEQTLFSHTGFVYFVILSVWFTILDFLNFIPISKISDLPEPASFEPVWSSLVYAGRSLSIIMASIASSLVYFIAKTIGANRFIATIVALLFAISPGLVRQSLVMHTELPSMIFFLAAFLAGISAGKATSPIEYRLLMVSAFCATLATMAKMQIIPLIMALPLILTALNAGKTNSLEPTQLRYPINKALAYGFTSIAFSIPAFVMIGTQIFPAQPDLLNFPNSGYQVFLAAYLLIIVVIYCWIDNRSWYEMYLGLAAISIGMSLAFYINFFHHDIQNTQNLVNFVDHMTAFTSRPTSPYDISFAATINSRLASSFENVLIQNYIIFTPFIRPFSPLYWLTLISIGIYVLSNHWRKAIIITIFLMIALGMETYSGLRSYAEHYKIYFEIWILLGLAIILIDLHSVWIDKKNTPNWKKLGIVICALIVLGYSVFGSLERASKKIVWHDREFGCGQAQGYMPDLINHFCTRQFLNPMPRNSF